MCVDIPGDTLAVGISGGVFSLPEVVAQLVDAAGAGFSVLRFIRLEAALVGVLFLLVRRHRSVSLADLMVDFYRRLLLHGVGHMGVDVQRGCRGNMTDDMEDDQIKAEFHELYQLMNGVRWRRWARSSIQCVSCAGSTSGRGLNMECRSEYCLHRNWRNKNWPGAVLAPGLAYLVRYV